jgi:predicted RNA-binding Zn ribbon-like protein
MQTNEEWAVDDRVEAAPRGDLHLLQDFVNTNDIEGGSDELGTPELLRDWLVQRGLVPDQTPADAAAHARALALREGIRALGRANNGEPLEVAQVEALNSAAVQMPVTVSIAAQPGDGAWALQPAASGIDAFLGRLLAIVTTAMADGTWSRIKACRNDTCRWLFFDQSRNRSGTWCSMAVCGSRMKARSYRARRRSAASA